MLIRTCDHIENDKILKSKAVRATGLFWNKSDLVNMEVTPDHLLKIATRTKGVYPVIPPLQCLPPRSDDVAASEPPDDQGGEDVKVPPLIAIPRSAKVPSDQDSGGPRLPIQQRSPLNQQELSQLPFSAGILPEGGDGPTKRVLESDDSRRETKQSKVQSYSEKHQATEVLEEREPKQIKTSLQSSPTFAGNIRLVADYGGVEIMWSLMKIILSFHMRIVSYAWKNIWVKKMVRSILCQNSNKRIKDRQS